MAYGSIATGSMSYDSKTYHDSGHHIVENTANTNLVSVDQGNDYTDATSEHCLYSSCTITYATTALDQLSHSISETTLPDTFLLFILPSEIQSNLYRPPIHQ
ncbi:hypothetical protein N9R79_03885 [Vibrio sp.]|nr:hypothetical protein [Vibrio sp.]